ncbi:mechanosensitive ion channel family protein [Legionella jordanis]|uniref:Small-conductance mechanosensitive channel n=1 Tax=Legionella jordanis TaxID=456 RepID=A0A0W0VHE6_9GAMM|nr:mechanosensitive ion channel domain-containing protein [Legionella jordanis]KTD19097.1 small-conductance mechanosensitive channel [Legionella jordanis]RMW99307.1 mechanosensitive ion channel family protein [Legionella jordanis]VEH12937.1 small-conductance mechanosensitive channel [Legionella jordanis]HAT8715287.1 mechanosensitive ion channel [Legionella jordanis]
MTQTSKLSSVSQPGIKSFTVKLRQIIYMPLLVTLAAIAGNFIYNFYILSNLDSNSATVASLVESFIYYLTLSLCFFWIIIRVISSIKRYIQSGSLPLSHPIINLLLPSISSIIKAVAFLIIATAFIQHLGLPEEFSFLLEKISSVLIIFSMGWILYKVISLGETLTVHRYQMKVNCDVTARKMFTQVLILKRIALAIVTILVVGSSLMLFDNVKALGASVLTTAGVFGLIVTFTAQKTLSGLFAGLEIALTQPIKIGDSVVIDNEFGVIEEINFRNVVVKLWDWRRLIVPTVYFLEQPFQNWSREQSNNMIGSVYLYADFTLPVDELRDELKRILTESALWDRKIQGIQVTDLQDKAMQLRVVASARTASDAWNLRCEMREKLIAFISKNYPLSLPASRTLPSNI